MDEPRWNSDLAAFRQEFAKAKHIVVLTGAGISAESGVPTFRGPGGYWRTYRVQDIATPEAFARNPSLVWELYHYRREVMMTKEPNKAHYAIAACEKRLSKQDRKVTVITQNIDELHRSAGTENLLELHGTLFKTRCVKCGTVKEARNNPLVPALQGRGMPEPNANSTPIPEKDLPRCQEDGCDSLVRPHVVWFGESLNDEVLRKTDEELESCDLCLVVGTSSVVYPAAMFAPMLASRGVTVAEFNMEETQATSSLKYHFHGPAGEFVPQALARHESEPVE
ncbi:putative NAD-dependent protein deacylase sirtuin-5, mitochondrial-like [Apostichopus japonicus]|uniref:NAD-dependent protein deacylase n=1 Tax=Stichopus japonicus TaxID=307972 RepID=A0A2G8LEI3_STIJA|nr:putative NAD-dependent protein deacylase sirtuin-5, mitochondrial-like [Apostichopus japonicus]